MSGGEVLLVVAIGLLVIATSLPTYARRAGRALPTGITAQLDSMGEAELPPSTTWAMKRSRMLNPHFKLVDLEMDDGRIFRHVWVIEDRWPTLSLRRALAGFKSSRVISVHEHTPAQSDSD